MRIQSFRRIHECFDTFANVKRSIAGDEVDDLCYFGTTGNMYVNVLTYNVEGTKIYYANPYGVMERYGVFKLDTNAVNYEALASGKLYGYALSDGTVTGFYDSEVEAAYSSFSATNTNIQLSDRKSTRLNSSHNVISRMPSSA